MTEVGIANESGAMMIKVNNSFRVGTGIVYRLMLNGNYYQFVEKW
jgi:hypothetical protein